MASAYPGGGLRPHRGHLGWERGAEGLGMGELQQKPSWPRKVSSVRAAVACRVLSKPGMADGAEKSSLRGHGLSQHAASAFQPERTRPSLSALESTSPYETWAWIQPWPEMRSAQAGQTAKPEVGMNG